MATMPDVPTDNLDHIKFLINSIFSTALYARYNWSALPDRLHYVQDYIAAMIEAGLQIIAVREPTVSELPDTMPRSNTSFAKLLAHLSFVLIVKAQKPAV